MEKFDVIKHMRYEVGNEEVKKVFIIPNTSTVPDLKNVLCLSDTSLMIWDMIVEGKSNDEIKKTLVKRFAIESGIIENDCDEFIEGLKEKGFINVVMG